jgi:hypothetical protein
MNQSQSWTRFWRVGLAGHMLFVGLIVVLADLGRLPALVFMPRYDLVGHFILIGLLAFFLNGVMRAKVLRIGKLRFYQASVMVFAVALVEELSQGFLANRTVSLWDLLAGTAGILFFSWLAARLVGR